MNVLPVITSQERFTISSQFMLEKEDQSREELIMVVEQKAPDRQSLVKGILYID